MQQNFILCKYFKKIKQIISIKIYNYFTLVNIFLLKSMLENNTPQYSCPNQFWKYLIFGDRKTWMQGLRYTLKFNIGELIKTISFKFCFNVSLEFVSVIRLWIFVYWIFTVMWKQCGSLTQILELRAEAYYTCSCQSTWYFFNKFEFVFVRY